MPVIYRTHNKINGKMYIGSDINNNPQYFGSGILIARAIKKYGKDHFEKEILEECDISAVGKKEEYWLKEYNCADDGMYYNIVNGYLGGKTSTSFKKGHKPNKTSFKKGQLAWNKGKPFSETHNLDNVKNGRIKSAQKAEDSAKNMTADERKKRWGHQKGKKLSKETLEKRRNTIANMSDEERKIKFGRGEGPFHQYHD